MGIDEVRTLLRTSWHLNVISCEPLDGGMNSLTWLIELDGHHCVAKAVPAAERRPFEAGLAAAEHLSAGGIAAGRPLRAADGALSVRTDSSTMALLEFVPGRPLVRDDPLDQHWWGDALGAVHRALAGFNHSGLSRFQVLRTDGAHLGVEDWVRPAVADAMAAMARLTVTDQLTYGTSHGDPSPDSFRFDLDTGRTGIIDWGAAGSGPLMYDVASAVMYAGGPAEAGDLVEAYLSAGPVSRDELEATLPTMLRFRYAVQAYYFAHRVWVDDRRGVDGPEDNLSGLRRAQGYFDLT
jgi:Ser/Thr protein kinase RdoA (MazF antagonist)